MSSKRGRKCSIKTCDNFQHTHKHLSFFRFPKDPERCRIWIEKTKRFDLLDKINVHDERICQQHFEATMFLNESQNRLQQYAVPTLYLTTKPVPIQAPAPPLHNLISGGFAANVLPPLNTNIDMGMMEAAAALLYQNNLTITPVFSIPNTKQPLSAPLKLSTCSQNGKHSMNSDSSNGSPVKMVPATNGADNLLKMPMTNGSRRPRQVFTFDQENQLADYVRETSNYYSGLSSKEVRIMAFVYGVCNQVEMPSGWLESHQASFDWCVGFIKRTKLPPAMITGISTKGAAKHTKSIEHNHVTSLKPNQIPVDTSPIEID